MTDKFSENYELKDIKTDGIKLSASLFIPKDLVFFDGHFDKVPILPGIIQLHWAITLASKHLDMKGIFTRVDLLKFKKIIQPDNLVQLDIFYDSNKHMMDFRYTSSIGEHSFGKVSFAS